MPTRIRLSRLLPAAPRAAWGLGFRAVDPVGAASPSRLRDALLESALAVLQDCEGSVAAVGGADNIGACAKEIGLMKGGRAETFRKGGEAPTRSLAPDRKAPTPPDRPGAADRARRRHPDDRRRGGRDRAAAREGRVAARSAVACAMQDLDKTMTSTR